MGRSLAAGLKRQKPADRYPERNGERAERRRNAKRHFRTPQESLTRKVFILPLIETFAQTPHGRARARRLTKVHTESRKALLTTGWRWMELDCANSSDALLMNIFCYRRTVATHALSSS
jgi:hypothetical protein